MKKLVCVVADGMQGCGILRERHLNILVVCTFDGDTIIDMECKSTGDNYHFWEQLTDSDRRQQIERTMKNMPHLVQDVPNTARHASQR